MPAWVSAGLWGLTAASPLLIGAALAMAIDFPARLIGGIMAFGCGVLISAVAYDLILDAHEQGGLPPVLLGALVGSVAYTVANWAVARGGGQHRKRSGGLPEGSPPQMGTAIAIGSLLDGIPESIVLGVGVLGEGISMPMLIAVLLSNLPEGLSSAVGMRKAGRSNTEILTLWAGIVATCGVAALSGALLLNGAAPSTLATVNAVAAGALLTMVAETMIPEAVEGERSLTGLLVVAGLLVAFALYQSKA